MEPVVAPRTFSGRYEVTHLIARGGMAQVYRALDTRLGRHVALKVLFPELSVDRTFVERFRREAQAAANLSHPNIVAVYDWGEDEGTYFIVMELITGTSLATALRAEKTMPATRAASIAAQVASALAYAHRHGVVHRDIKPGNVLLTDDGQVKVTDFGIAQAVSTEEGLTMAGSVMGTAAYFSPEQAEGAVVDGRSDLYSLGVVLYEMLAGRPPYVGDSPVAVASMHVRNEPPLLRDLSPAVPEPLERITMRALAKSPEDRYQTADEMRADLVRFGEGQPVLAAAGPGAAMGATSVMGGAATTSVLPPKDNTMAVPAVAGLGAAAVAHDEAPYSEEVQRRQNASRTTWIVLALVVALAVVGILTYRGLSGASTITIPPVVGQDYQAATSTLVHLGLKVSQKSQATSAHQPGTVLSVLPPAGTSVQPGAPVTLTYAVAPVLETVPPVTGRQLQDALSALKAAHLNGIQVTVPTWTSAVIPGSVLEQSQPAGKSVPAGTVVKLTLLMTGGTFPLPNVVDMSPIAAATTLGQYGLNTPTQTSACSNNTSQGRVSATTPTYGTPVAAGDNVSLVISSGACPVVVPNVLGLMQSVAVSTISAAQLRPVLTGCTSGPTSTGIVANQLPTYPNTAKPGSSVTIEIGCTGGNSGTTGNSGATGIVPGRVVHGRANGHRRHHH
ncbi:MAG TPA: Stk1 family PASTA domain-containing Ser/Thr kinase [Acidimicrobiales bacterium]|jgi:serine/threonine-protein kinase|nr:Stk1 family PASTA domain-containing Ser/Thr kinase [Acidimicrobiales bacterium]